MCEQMQSLALAEGALLRHLYTALYTKSTDNRMLTHRCFLVKLAFAFRHSQRPNLYYFSLNRCSIFIIIFYLYLCHFSD